MTTYNDMHTLTPQLFMTPPMTVTYVVFTMIVYTIITAYYVACCVSVCLYSSKNTSGLNHSTKHIKCLGDIFSCLLFILCMDTFQLFITTLSFRLPAIAAFTFCIHFLCSTFYTGTLLTQYASYEKLGALFKQNKFLSMMVTAKSVVVSTLGVNLGICCMIFSLTLFLGVGNSFYIKTANITFASINLFMILMIFYCILIESVLHRAMKMNFGFHCGLFIGLCGLLYPTHKYESIYASEWSYTIDVNLGIVGIVWIIFTICRIIRTLLPLRHRKHYKPLLDEETEPLK